MVVDKLAQLEVERRRRYKKIIQQSRQVQSVTLHSRRKQQALCKRSFLFRRHAMVRAAIQYMGNVCIFYLLNCFNITSVCKSTENMKITDFFKKFFLKMGTSPKSSLFATVGSRTSTQQRGSATG